MQDCRPETVLKNGIIQPDKFIKAQAVSVDLVHVVVHCLLVHADYIGTLRLRFRSSLVEEVV